MLDAKPLVHPSIKWVPSEIMSVVTEYIFYYTNSSAENISSLYLEYESCIGCSERFTSVCEET